MEVARLLQTKVFLQRNETLYVDQKINGVEISGA
jgi:hypothetical protein